MLPINLAKDGAIADEPKPLAWKLRARVGDRRQWWTDVDEVG